MADSLATTDEARTQMLSDLSHEIRTPLATLEAHIDGLEDEVIPTTAATYHVMRGQVHRLRRLASDVRLAAQAQEHALDLHPTATKASDLVHSACALYEPRYRDKGVLLDDRSRHDPRWSFAWTGTGCSRSSETCWTTPCGTPPPGGTVSVGCHQNGQAVEIAVTDSGEGIDPADVDRVFQRFQRLDTSRQSDSGGSGLGLTIARALVQSQHGDVTAHSAGLGTGSTFTIRLPQQTMPTKGTPPTR
ncbi:MAG: HAMP domain-containing sensor histidine kinase [Candidatus Nanopelagicales bacterium]